MLASDRTGKLIVRSGAVFYLKNQTLVAAEKLCLRILKFGQLSERVGVHGKSEVCAF